MKNNSKKKKAARIILAAAGIISALYGAAVVSCIGTGHWFNTAFIILGAGIILTACLLPSITKWIKTNKSGKIIASAICIILCLALLNFSIFEIKVLKFAASKPADHASWVIVLGAKVKVGTGPSLEYSVRLKNAAQYINNQALYAKQNSSLGKNNVRLILTGGKGPDEPITEAEGGYEYLTKNGYLIVGDEPDAVISKSNIFLEKKSTSTSENMKFAMEIIKENGGSEEDSVVIVSSSFHLYRASELAKEAGFKNTSYSGSTGLKLLIPFYYVREYAAYVREHL